MLKSNHQCRGGVSGLLMVALVWSKEFGEGFHPLVWSRSWELQGGLDRDEKGRFGDEFDKFDTSLWVHNLFNKYYSIRGFYFGNEPPNFEDTLYERHGDPRRFGLSLQYDL